MSNAAAPTPKHGAPSDHTTMIEVLDGYHQSGYTADFSPEDGAQVRCGHCQTASAASTYPIRSLRRLEGASDPDDMIAVIASACPVCGADGTLVLGFGPTASGTDADVMQALDDRRDDDQDVPRDASPDETAAGTTT